MSDLTQSERATYQALIARGYSEDDAREAALDGVNIEDVRKPKKPKKPLLNDEPLKGRQR